MASILWKCGLFALTGTVCESKYGPAKKKSSGSTQEGNSTDGFFGVTPLLLIGVGFWITIHGMVVSKARTKYLELAKKDGEENVDERYGYPNLYAQGTSKHARSFNCIQRSHQHIFETYVQLCVAGITGALSYPITTAVSVFAYAIGRYSLSQGYAKCGEEYEGDASKRYSSSPLARYMWYGLLSTYIVGMISSIKLLAKDKMW